MVQTRAACAAGCEASSEVYRVLSARAITSNDSSVFADHPDRAKVLHETMPLPIVAQIVEGRVAIEAERVTFAPGTAVTVQTLDGRRLDATLVATAVCGLRLPAEATITIDESESEKQLSAPVLAAEGRYRRDTGITIEMGTPATVLVRGRAVRGQIVEDSALGLRSLTLSSARGGHGINDRVQMREGMIDEWLRAKIISEELPTAMAAELVAGEVDVESDKVSFRPGSEVTAVTVGGKRVRATLLGTAAIALRAPIHAVVETNSTDLRKRAAGLLIHSKGFYRKGEGVRMEKGTRAIVLLGETVRIGALCEEIVIDDRLLAASRPLRGFRRLTR
jgi:hypothetical protein